MAEETNVAISNPTASGAEMEHSQQDNGVKAAEKATDEGVSEPPMEGAGEEEAADSMFRSSNPL